MAMRFGPVPPNRFRPSERWEHFDIGRTIKAGGDYRLLYEHLTNVSYPSGSTHRDIITMMANVASPPIAIDSLDRCLGEPTLSRGGVLFGWTGDLIDQYVKGYLGLRWWQFKEGLVVAMVGPKDRPLSDFDRKAGELWLEHAIDGELSYEALVQVAGKLDAANFPFKENLEPAQWKIFAAEAERTKKRAPKTFSEAVRSPKHQERIRQVRLRLSRAKARYGKSIYGSAERA